MNLSIIIYAALFFLLSELYIVFSKRSHKPGTQQQKDKKSLWLFWVLIPLSITLGFMFAKHSIWNQTNQIIAYTGILIALSGLVIRWVAIKQLKNNFTVDVAIVQNHQLITGGLYQKTRHPAYLGLWLFAIGLAIAMNSFWSFLIIATAFSIAVYYRIQVEEQLLEKTFGDNYRTYKNKTPAFFPFP